MENLLKILFKVKEIFQRHKTRILAKFFLIFFLLLIVFVNYKYLTKVISYLNYRVLSVKLAYAPKLPSFLLNDASLAKSVLAEELSGDLFIPKIQTHAPIVFTGDDTNTNPLHLKPYLNKGVLFYPGSVLPGQKGRTIILGHSAPANWPKINYDTVFSELNRLTEGDEVRIEMGDKVFAYKVAEKIFLQKGEDIPDFALTNSENMLILISCWPPGKDYKRIAIAAALE